MLFVCSVIIILIVLFAGFMFGVLKMAHYFFDENRIRYTLAGTGEGAPYSWLFIPGGPGGDSGYLRTITDLLELPGNLWLIDLPGNGTNVADDNYNFDQWFKLFLPMVSKFENPILVGHSFGGMFPLLFPKLENVLKGLIMLHSAPSNPSTLKTSSDNISIPARISHQSHNSQHSSLRNLPDLKKPMAEFLENPSEKTFNIALEACIPYYFAPEYLEQGKKFLEMLYVQFRPSFWWQKTAGINYNASWVPQKVPTLAIGGDFDSMLPFSIFEEDQRFKRDNIRLKRIKNSGHFSWIDQPDVFKSTVTDFLEQIILPCLQPRKMKFKSKL